MMTDVSVGVMAKRKRGRPRKDSNVCREGSFQSAETSALMNMKTAVAVGESAADGSNKMNDDGMVGSMVHGVVEGSFDAGYLISVRIGTNLTPFRGVVFQPRKVVPLTPANDVAPQAKMYHRRELPVPTYDDNNNNNNNDNNNNNNNNPNQSQPKQDVLPYNQNQSSTLMANDEAMLNTTSATSAKQFPHVHLRMVEEDEVMQAFEVSTSSNLNGDKQSKAVESAQMVPAPPQPAFQMNAGESGQAMKSSDLFYNEGRSQDVNMFKGESASKSPNLQLDLGFTVNKEKVQMMGGDGSIYNALINGMKNPSMGYHQALVSGNPLLLPPDLMGEPLELMMERPKCKTSEETNMEVQSRLVGGGEQGEGTRISDMDFVISHPTQSNPFPSHNNQS